jgi:hypothetical protein
LYLYLYPEGMGYDDNGDEDLDNAESEEEDFDDAEEAEVDGPKPRTKRGMFCVHFYVLSLSLCLPSFSYNLHSPIVE